jgi:hypothetical protein
MEAAELAQQIKASLEAVVSARLTQVVVVAAQGKRAIVPRQATLEAMAEMVFHLASMDRLLHGRAVVAQDARPRGLAALVVAAMVLTAIQVRQRKTAQ